MEENCFKFSFDHFLLTIEKWLSLLKSSFSCEGWSRFGLKRILDSLVEKTNQNLLQVFWVIEVCQMVWILKHKELRWAFRIEFAILNNLISTNWSQIVMLSVKNSDRERYIRIAQSIFCTKWVMCKYPIAKLKANCSLGVTTRQDVMPTVIFDKLHVSISIPL